MQARITILTGLIGGPLFGTLLGLAADPTMVSPPEPAWHRARPDPAYSQPPAPVAEPGPQYLSATWYLDRMPTWKRRALERAQAAAGYADYVADMPAALPEPRSEAQPPAPAAAVFPAKTVEWSSTAPANQATGQPAAAPQDAETGAKAVEAHPAIDGPTIAVADTGA